MIIQKRSLNHILKSVNLLNLLLLLIFLSIFCYFPFLLTENSRINPIPIVKGNVALDKKSIFDWNLIGSGALSLSSDFQSFPFPDLIGEIVFKGKNTRPDVSFQTMQFELQLKKSQETLKLKPNQMTYLTYGNKKLHFSNEPSPFWIQPKVDDNGDVWLKMGIELMNSEGERLLNEERKIKIEEYWKTKKVCDLSDPELKKGIEVIQKGKWWDPDKLFEGYGGVDYQSYVGMQRFEVGNENRKEFLFFREDETYVWKGGKWIQSDQTKGVSVAKVISMTPYKLEWQFWSPEGLESATLTFTREKAQSVSLRIEDVFIRLRKRTSSRISCRIDNRAKILKEGDWLVHTSTGWHTIRHYYEVEALLNLEILGELFIFDGIQVVDGKEIFAGSLFNPMRTEVKSIRLPLSHTKGNEHSSHTKNSLSTKINALAHDEGDASMQRGRQSKKFEEIEDLELIDDD